MIKQGHQPKADGKERRPPTAMSSIQQPPAGPSMGDLTYMIGQLTVEKNMGWIEVSKLKKQVLQLQAEISVLTTKATNGKPDPENRPLKEGQKETVSK